MFSSNWSLASKLEIYVFNCSVYRSQEARKDPLDGRGEEELSGEQTEKALVTCRVDEAWGKDKGKKENYKGWKGLRGDWDERMGLKKVWGYYP